MSIMYYNRLVRKRHEHTSSPRIMTPSVAARLLTMRWRSRRTVYLPRSSMIQVNRGTLSTYTCSNAGPWAKEDDMHPERPSLLLARFFHTLRAVVGEGGMIMIEWREEKRNGCTKSCHPLTYRNAVVQRQYAIASG